MYYGIPYIYGLSLRISLKHKVLKQNVLILTFDDGPGARMTPTILNMLAEYNAKASFFILGCNIAGREDIVKQIAAGGHEICSHGYQHLDHWRASPFKCLSDIKRGWQAIDTALGVGRGKYVFRPPYGKLNLLSLVYLLIRKVPTVLWTIDSGDRATSKTNNWTLKNYDTEHTVLKAKKVGGAVVLAHDSDRRNLDTEAFTLETVRSVLLMAKESSMKVMTASQFLNYK